MKNDDRVHHPGARTERKTRGFNIPTRDGCADVSCGRESQLAEPATVPSLWLSSSSCFKSWKASLPWSLPTLLLDFQEYVCFLIKGTNTTGSSPSPASSCLEHGHDAWSRRSHLPAAGGKGQDDHRVAGLSYHSPSDSRCLLPDSLFGEKNVSHSYSNVLLFRAPNIPNWFISFAT